MTFSIFSYKLTRARLTRQVTYTERVTMTASTTQAVATAIAHPLITALLRLAQDPTVRQVARDADVIAAWRDAYGPVKKAIRVTSDAFKQIGGANGLAAA